MLLQVIALAGLFLAPANSQETHPLQIESGSELTISPSGPMIMEAGSNRQFVANAIQSEGISVRWAIEGDECTKVDCGTIATDGLYSAPKSVTVSLHFRVVAYETQAPFLATSERVAIVPSGSKGQRGSCKTVQPGYFTLLWQIHQTIVPFVW